MEIDISAWEWYKSVYEVIEDMPSHVECTNVCSAKGNECTMTFHFNDSCYMADLANIQFGLLDSSPSNSITLGLVKQSNELQIR